MNLSVNRPLQPPFGIPRWIAALVLFGLLGNVFSWIMLGILPDEAYYWVWSQRPELGYFDHPPLIAWLMWPFTALFGHEVWAARLPAVIAWVVGSLLSYQMAQRLFGGYAGALALLVWSSMPLVQVGFHIVTPDSALMTFSWLTLWFAWRAGTQESPRLWLVTGLMAGLAMLGKYPAVLLLGAPFMALLGSRSGRRQLMTPWPWLGAIMAIVVFLPDVYWNAQHDWASFAFQFGHGVRHKAEVDHLKLFLFFLGGQLAVAMPWTFFAMAWTGSRVRVMLERLDGYSVGLLMWNFWLPLVVFGLAGLTSKSGPNWPITAYCGGTVILAGALNRWLLREGNWRRGRVMVTILLVVLTIVLVDVMRFPHWLQGLVGEGFTPKRTQLSQNYGWEKLKPELQQLLATLPHDCTILADNQARAGMLAWLLDEPQRVTTSRDVRYSQYDIWRDEQSSSAPICLYFQQFDNEFTSKSAISEVIDLPEGRFEQVMLVTADNPDLSLRWFVLYRPVTGEASTH
jgi:hypothetical protein